MNKYIINTSSKMEVEKVRTEKTSYEKIKCIKNDGTCIFKNKNEIYNTYEEAQKQINEARFVASFKRKMKSKKYNNWRCVYCGQILNKKSEVTVDHVVPKSRGGKTAYDNLVICCVSCNKMKSSKHQNHYTKLMNRNAKVKMKRPNKFSGKIKNIAHKSHGLNAEAIARMDGNTISLKGLNLKKNKQNMVDRVLADYNNRRANNEYKS